MSPQMNTIVANTNKIEMLLLSKSITLSMNPLKASPACMIGIVYHAQTKTRTTRASFRCL